MHGSGDDFGAPLLWNSPQSLYHCFKTPTKIKTPKLNNIGARASIKAVQYCTEKFLKSKHVPLGLLKCCGMWRPAEEMHIL